MQPSPRRASSRTRRRVERRADGRPRRGYVRREPSRHRRAGDAPDARPRQRQRLERLRDAPRDRRRARAVHADVRELQNPQRGAVRQLVEDATGGKRAAKTRMMTRRRPGSDASTGTRARPRRRARSGDDGVREIPGDALDPQRLEGSAPRPQERREPRRVVRRGLRGAPGSFSSAPAGADVVEHRRLPRARGGGFRAGALFQKYPGTTRGASLFGVVSADKETVAVSA